MEAATPPAITSSRQRWLYAFANLGPILVQQSFGAYALFFYTDVRHLPPAWVSAALVIYAFYNAINNPVLGYLGDRTKHRLGRRIPYILFGAVPMAIAYALIWLAPFDGLRQPLALIIWFGVLLVIWDGLYSAACTIAYYGLLPEMFASYEERTDVSLRMNLFLLLGLVLGLALPPLIYSTLGWGAMGLIFGAVAAASLLIGLRGMFERPAPPEASPVASWFEEVKLCIRNRSFMSLLAAQTLRFVVVYTLTAGIPFYVKYTLHADAIWATAILGVAIVTAAPALWLWQKFGLRLGPRSTLMSAFLVMGSAMLPLAVAQDVWGAIAAALPIGVGLSGLIFMGDLLITDVVDEDELRTGRRREGVFYGFMGLITTLSSALSALLFGVISAQFGYNPALGTEFFFQQPETVGQGFRFFMTLPPFAACALAATVLLFYELHGPRLVALKREVSARRAALAEPEAAMR